MSNIISLDISKYSYVMVEYSYIQSIPVAVFASKKDSLNFIDNYNLIDSTDYYFVETYDGIVQRLIERNETIDFTKYYYVHKFLDEEQINYNIKPVAIFLEKQEAEDWIYYNLQSQIYCIFDYDGNLIE